MDAMKPLLMLKGNWHGTGLGPYGPYDFDHSVEARGRWLLLKSSVFEPNKKTETYISTQVLGYSEKGLTLQFFDTAGSFDFTGMENEGVVRFDWKDGENWKRSVYIAGKGGKIHYKYESMEPATSKELLVFEGDWLTGRRVLQSPDA